MYTDIFLQNKPHISVIITVPKETPKYILLTNVVRQAHVHLPL